MRYCMNGSEFGGWQDAGINTCLYGTVGAVIPFTYNVIVSGIFLLRRKRKKGEEKKARDVEKGNNPDEVEKAEEAKEDLGQRSWDFVIRMLLGAVLMFEVAVHGVLQDLVTGQRDIIGQQVLTSVLGGLTWILYLHLESSAPYDMPHNQVDTVAQEPKWPLSVFLCLAVLREILAFVSWSSPWYWWSVEGPSDKTEFGLWVIRLTASLLLVSLRLLPPQLCPPRQHEPVSTDEKQDTQKKKKERKKSTWANVFNKLKVMVPYVWPKESVRKQCLVVVCLFILGLGRGVNLLVPIISKAIINCLSVKVMEKNEVYLVHGNLSSSGQETTNPSVDMVTGPSVAMATRSLGSSLVEIFPVFCWRKILLFSFLMFLKGGGAGNSGMLNNLRSFFWIPVQQYTTRHIQINLFHHLHSLSLRWHLQRRTGEVLKVVDRGTNSINMLLSHLLFQILPIIADITIAIIYFISAFNYLFGLIVFFCMAIYISISVVMTEWRTKYRRDMNRLDNEKNAKAVDALLNFETVKYYGAADYEKGQYKAAILKYQKAEFVSALSFNLLNTMQNIVITCGMVLGTLLCGWAVVYSLKDLHLSVGDYVLFGTYINQLYGPLQWLGNYYRMIQQAFVDMENMFDLFDESAEIKDVPGAKPIHITSGQIEFRNVTFHYDPRYLHKTSLLIQVGHSGSGKSTVIRLLFRFYDVTDGSILVDGQDISQVQQESLRQCIGVVPQDTVMFNNNIKYNIRYGKVTASEEEVEGAAEAADIHHRILTFPCQYDTLVGERGLKLSGGEKQRVAIARTLLKSPMVVLLDEATSALDTKTERNIQNSLFRVCENRTNIVVAHRLSTIIHANQILVLQEGEVIERGSHKELLEIQGIYADMWHQQLTSREITAEDTDENSDPS